MNSSEKNIGTMFKRKCNIKHNNISKKENKKFVCSFQFLDNLDSFVSKKYKKIIIASERNRIQDRTNSCFPRPLLLLAFLDNKRLPISYKKWLMLAKRGYNNLLDFSPNVIILLDILIII